MKKRDFTKCVRPFLRLTESQAYTFGGNDLVFKGGDVIVVTGPYKSDTFVVHSRHLMERS